MLDKELALIFEWKNAPVELQAIAESLRKANNRMVKAKAENAAAKDEHAKILDVFSVELEKWLKGIEAQK